MFDDDAVDFTALTAEAESLVESFRHLLPKDLESIPPGPFLAAILSTVDESRLNGHDAVRVMQAHGRMAAHHQARGYAVMNEVAYCPAGSPRAPVARDAEEIEFAAHEIRAALTMTRRRAESELGMALSLRQRLPEVWELLDAGLIDVARARTIVYGTEHLSESNARDVADRVLDQAPDLTTGQLAALVRRLCVETNPDEGKKRYEDALQERRFVTVGEVSGAASIYGLNLAPDRVSAISNKIDQLAHGLTRSNDPRTIDQIRADVFLDLLEGKEAPHGRSNATVAISVDLTTLAGLDDRAAEIPGMGPVIADIARQMAHQDNVRYEYAVTNDLGQVIHTGTTRRRPTADQTRRIHAQHPTCVFPGCRMPASQCDIDHHNPWADGGPTSTTNLAPLCPHDHRAREGGWTPQLRVDGRIQWASPLGHAYTTAGRPP